MAALGQELGPERVGARFVPERFVELNERFRTNPFDHEAKLPPLGHPLGIRLRRSGSRIEAGRLAPPEDVVHGHDKGPVGCAVGSAAGSAPDSAPLVILASLRWPSQAAPSAGTN